MIALKAALLCLVAASNIIIGLLVLSRNKRKFNALVFFTLLISVGGWAVGIAGYLLSNSADYALLWAKAFYVFPIIIGLSLVFFTYSFPFENYKRIPLLLRYGVVIFALIVLAPLVAIPHYLTEGIVYHNWGKSVTLDALPYSIYSIYIVATFSVAIWTIYRKMHVLRGLFVKQAQLLFLSIFISSLFGIIFNLIVPALGNYRLIWLGPLFTGVLAVGIGISIVRHRMFDIRLVVARALAYSLSIVLLLGGYSLASYAIIDNLANQLSGTPKVLVNLLLILVAAASYAPLKRYFDKITNRLFYRDAYDASALYSDLNRVLASSLDMKYLMTESAGIIEAALKPEFAAIGLKDGDGQRIFATHPLKFSQGDIDFARHQTPHIHHKVIVADELSDTRYEQFKKLLNDNDIAVLVRLTQNLRSEEEGLGYLVMGVKKSGNPYSSQDVRVLDTVANELIIAIQNALHFEEIQKFNITLQAQVDEATKKLRRTNERLKALDETKDDFISMASHQLRTPLTSVKGYLSMVMEGDAGKITATQRKMLTQAFTSSQRMVYLIADLLNVSRLKTGKFAIETSPVNLPEVIAEEMEQLTETVKAKEIKLTYKKPKDFPEVMLDETKTRQVIMNFVDNAIYYTPQGGKIEVQLEHTPDTIEFKVVDNGIGVPASERHHLFTKFYRAKNAQKARPDGTGLGLFMAKKVIVAEGGSIIFDSKEGKGSTFGFSFPLSKIKTEADSARQPAAS